MGSARRVRGFRGEEGGRAREERKERSSTLLGMTIVALVDDAREANVEGKVSACCARNESVGVAQAEEE